MRSTHYASVSELELIFFTSRACLQVSTYPGCTLFDLGVVQDKCGEIALVLTKAAPPLCPVVTSGPCCFSLGQLGSYTRCTRGQEGQ